MKFKNIIQIKLSLASLLLLTLYAILHVCILSTNLSYTKHKTFNLKENKLNILFKVFINKISKVKSHQCKKSVLCDIYAQSLAKNDKIKEFILDLVEFKDSKKIFNDNYNNKKKLELFDDSLINKDLKDLFKNYKTNTKIANHFEKIYEYLSFVLNYKDFKQTVLDYFEKSLSKKNLDKEVFIKHMHYNKYIVDLFYSYVHNLNDLIYAYSNKEYIDKLNNRDKIHAVVSYGIHGKNYKLKDYEFSYILSNTPIKIISKMYYNNILNNAKSSKDIYKLFLTFNKKCKCKTISFTDSILKSYLKPYTIYKINKFIIEENIIIMELTCEKDLQFQKIEKTSKSFISFDDFLELRN